MSTAPKTIGILTNVFCPSGSNFVFLAWTDDKLTYRQAHDWPPKTRTYAGNNNTRTKTGKQAFWFLVSKHFLFCMEVWTPGHCFSLGHRTLVYIAYCTTLLWICSEMKFTGVDPFQTESCDGLWCQDKLLHKTTKVYSFIKITFYSYK